MTNNKSEIKVLYIGDDEDSYTDSLGEAYDVKAVQTLEAGKRFVDEDSLDIVIIEDLEPSAITEIKSSDPSVEVVHVLDERNASTILAAAMAGASGYLVTPFEQDELLAVLEMLKRNKKVRDKYDTTLLADGMPACYNEFIGQSPAFLNIISRAAKLKGHSANVLVTGESGTGKEMLARFINQLEGDPKRPFVAINCAAIPEMLLESELFGHEKGAFTGATQRKLGKFEMANGGGDIFLDEINSLKPEMQAKLLRVIEEKSVCRLGSNTPIKLNFRIIAASNGNLENMIKEGSFRLDLYHRLNVIQLSMPPLRDRIDDIPILVEHFLQKHNKPSHRKLVTSEALDILKSYSWPGNIRELENLIHNLIIMAPNGKIEADDIPLYVINSPVAIHNATTMDKFLEATKTAKAKEILAMTNGNKSEASRILEISRTTLNEILKEK